MLKIVFIQSEKGLVGGLRVGAKDAVPSHAAQENIERRLIPEDDVGHARAGDRGILRSWETRKMCDFKLVIGLDFQFIDF